MQKLKITLLFSLLTFFVGQSTAQTVDSLNVFPNPFNTSATIHFDLAQSGTVSLRVFNLSGTKLLTYFQSTPLPSGSYNINLIGDTLPNGIYLVRLDIGSSKSITKKVSKISTTTGLTAKYSDKNKVLFPNPVSDMLSIPFEGEKTTIITDLNGRILQTNITSAKEISLLELTNGTYFINVMNHQKEIIASQKVVKM